MKTQRQRNVLEDRLTITQRITRSKTRENRRENALPIPVDLTLDIFSRLPAKSIARCRCVSNPWASILGRSDFKELFLTRSSARPQLLIACQTNSELFFFSSPQPQNVDDENSSTPVVVASYHMKISFDVYYSQICRPIHGLVCLTNQRISKARKETVPVIYNPSTGQSLLLPKVKTSRVDVFTMLGYDPIDKQFKLLSMTWSRYGANNVFEEHQVLTLGTRRNHSWRMIKCCRPHHSSSNKGICIDGVLYYTASENTSSQNSMVVCFDVRSEKFSFIQVPNTFIRNWHGVPIKYKGKLGFLLSRLVDRSTESIELCVLEEDVQWSKHTCVLPILWRDIVETTLLYIVGMTQTNEIVLVTHCQEVPFYVFYYNIERKTITKLQIQGMEAFKDKSVHVFLDHIEDLKLM